MLEVDVFGVSTQPRSIRTFLGIVEPLFSKERPLALSSVPCPDEDVPECDEKLGPMSDDMRILLATCASNASSVLSGFFLLLVGLSPALMLPFG